MNPLPILIYMAACVAGSFACEVMGYGLASAILLGAGFCGLFLLFGALSDHGR